MVLGLTTRSRKLPHRGQLVVRLQVAPGNRFPYLLHQLLVNRKPACTVDFILHDATMINCISYHSTVGRRVKRQEVGKPDSSRSGSWQMPRFQKYDCLHARSASSRFLHRIFIIRTTAGLEWRDLTWCRQDPTGMDDFHAETQDSGD